MSVMPASVRRYAYLSCCLLIALAIGACSPGSETSAPIPERLLQDHVRFLSQPSLEGRYPSTPGSAAAQQYIEGIFTNLGLVPWGQETGYDISFGPGTNIIGVLPGSDATLAKRFVVVCAHFDHLGTNSNGEVYPGACDNASGVAALLEIARNLSKRQVAPKRSICFAALDCEEFGSWGAYSFVDRADADSSKISGAVNIDMLGRTSYGILPRTLFALQTELFPVMEMSIFSAASSEGILVIPFGVSVAEGRDDLIAFQDHGIPGMFFTCGEFPGYHDVTDTADKIDYDSLAGESAVILEAVRALADGPEPARPKPASSQPVTTQPASSQPAK